MKVRSLIYVITGCLLVWINGCSLLLKNNYGYHDPTKFSEEEYHRFLATIDTSGVTTVRSEEASFQQYIRLGRDSIERKDLSQPLQLLYFEGESLVSFHANCYARGTLAGLEWDYDDRFNQFPPASAVEPNHLASNLSDLTSIYPQIKRGSGKRYTAVIIWSWMFEDVSRDAIALVRQHLAAHDVTTSTDVYLINVDDFWKAQFQRE